MKTIMCFGDSNTYGANTAIDGERYDWNTRWTALLQKNLGFEEYRVSEEGLGGRTTTFDDPFNPLLNGAKGLEYALATHRPIDMITISLGTNDVRSHFNMSVPGVLKGYEKLIQMIQIDSYVNNWKMPKILILSPPFIDDTSKCPFVLYDESSERKMRDLIPALQKFASDNDYLYFALSSVAKTGEDNLHMDKESHRKVADSLIGIIKEALK